MPATRTASAYGRAIHSERVVVGELASRRSLLAVLLALPLAERGPWLRTFADIGELTTAKGKGLEPMADTATSQTDRWIAEAYELGKQAAESAATWVGNGDPGLDGPHVRRLLAMLADGDPEAYDYLPTEPNLSGEWSGDPTPYMLAVQIVGEDALSDMTYPGSDSFVDSLADAFEQGVSDHFEQACEAELRRWVD